MAISNAFTASGLTGATQPSRYAGATTSGAPTYGVFAVGDFVIDRSGAQWICTAAGQPGTWIGSAGVSGTAAAGQVPTGTGPGAAAWAPGMTLLATTGVNGFALQNATPTIITWTMPSDGLMHRAFIIGQVRVTSTETGGAVGLSETYPDGSASTDTLDAGGHTATHQLFNARSVLVQAGSAVAVNQTSALTGGAATAWAEIWGS